MPITVNHFLLRETTASQNLLLQGFRESIATSSHDWNKLANKRAETILSATIFAAKNAISSGAEEGVPWNAATIPSDCYSPSPPLNTWGR